MRHISHRGSIEMDTYIVTLYSGQYMYNAEYVHDEQIASAV